MLMTSNQIRKLPNGTKMKIFMSGSDWGEDFGKVYDVIKVNDNELREITKDWWKIDEVDEKDNCSIEVAYNEKEDLY